MTPEGLVAAADALTLPPGEWHKHGQQVSTGLKREPQPRTIAGGWRFSAQSCPALTTHDLDCHVRQGHGHRQHGNTPLRGIEANLAVRPSTGLCTFRRDLHPDPALQDQQDGVSLAVNLAD